MPNSFETNCMQETASTPSGSFKKLQGVSKLNSNPDLGVKTKGKRTNLIEQPPVCTVAARPVCVSDGCFVLCLGPVAPRCPVLCCVLTEALPAACLLTAVHRSVSHPADHDWRLCSSKRLLCLRSLA